MSRGRKIVFGNKKGEKVAGGAIERQPWGFRVEEERQSAEI